MNGYDREDSPPECKCYQNANDGCLSLFIFIVLWSVLFWGEPDLIDGIIHFLMN